MKIHNVVEIFDNGEFVSIVTRTDSAVHLPTGQKHSITAELKKSPLGDAYSSVSVTVDLDTG